MKLMADKTPSRDHLAEAKSSLEDVISERLFNTVVFGGDGPDMKSYTECIECGISSPLDGQWHDINHPGDCGVGVFADALNDLVVDKPRI
tara:strand:+ start:1866 stop:2135 length:270 start_codon:yes stop_codon:yes gene_type:complete